MKNVLLVIFLSINSFTVNPVFANQLVIYEAPADAEAANDFELLVNGRKVFVYNTRPAAFASFSFEGKVDIKVIFGGVIYSYDIRPKNLSIPASAYGNKVHFSLEAAANISVEINKNIKRPLFIFANLLETTIPDKQSKQVIFFEAGKIHEPGIVNLQSNQTVYIEGCAIVRGAFLDIFPTSVMIGFDKDHIIKNVTLDNVSIHGRKATSGYAGMISTSYAENIVYK